MNAVCRHGMATIYLRHIPPFRLLHSQAMTTTTVFTNNRSQAVRLPAELRLPDGVKQVSVRARGKERIIAPLESSWDSFFLDGPAVSDDFLETRAPQAQAARESL